MDQVRVRFAPSPTGIPHVGNIRSALFNWLFARHAGGTLILRVEDTDRERYDEKSLPAILESLRWLGLDWDEGAEKGGEFGPYHQSERLGIYQEHADTLLASGQAYYCYCSSERLTEMRKRQREAKQNPKYDRTCLELTEAELQKLKERGVTPVLRFKIPDSGTTGWNDVVRKDVLFENTQLDDFVLMKSDGYPTYNFANIIDDHLMRISHVIRGEEFVSSTPKHLLLYRAFGYEPPRFVHVPLILGPDRGKLSKRHGATSVFEYRDQGYLPEAMVNFLSLLGWSPGNDQEYLSKAELVKLFTLEGINKSASIFDTNKLTAAHKALPFNTHVKVTNLENGKSVVVRINDRGPFIEGRIIDLSRAGAKAIAMTGAGIARVRVDIVKTAAATGTAPDTSRNLLCSIQVGAFSSRENALRLKSLLESNGLTPEFEFTDVGIIRVVLYNIPTPDLGKTTSSLRKLGISQVLIRYSN